MIGVGLGLAGGRRPPDGGVPPPPTSATIAGGEAEGMQLSVSPAGTSRQWRRDGVAIPGATTATYTLAREDVGATIDAVVDGEPTANNRRGRLRLHSRIVFFTDGVLHDGSAPGPANGVWRAMEAINYRLRPAVGALQTQSGQTFATMTARIDQVTGQKPDVIVFHGSVNDGGSASYTSDWRALLSLIEQQNPDAIIVACTTQPEQGDAAYLATQAGYRAYQAGQASGPGQGARGSAGKGRTVIADLGAGFDVAQHLTDASHPNRAGGQRNGENIAAALDPLVELAGADALLGQTGAVAELGIGANIYPQSLHQLGGSSGTKAGAVLPTGSVATGLRLTNNLANGSGVAVTALKETASAYEQQVVVLDGVAAAANTLTFGHAAGYPLGRSNAEAVGRYYEWLLHLVVEGADGGAPVGLKAKGAGYLGGVQNNQLAAPAGSYGRVDEVVRAHATAFWSVAAGSMGSAAATTPVLTLRFDGGVDLEGTRVLIDRIILREVELSPYAPPLLATFGVTGNEALGISGTVGGTGTLVGRPGRWSGGGISFDPVWKIGGAIVATGWTYAQASPPAGTVIEFLPQPSNTLGANGAAKASVTVA